MMVKTHVSVLSHRFLGWVFCFPKPYMDELEENYGKNAF